MFRRGHRRHSRGARGAVPHQVPQRTQHLVLAAEIAELARQEHVPPTGDPCLEGSSVLRPPGSSGFGTLGIHR
jgi:hypothetical protein